MELAHGFGFLFLLRVGQPKLWRRWCGELTCSLGALHFTLLHTRPGIFDSKYDDDDARTRSVNACLRFGVNVNCVCVLWMHVPFDCIVFCYMAMCVSHCGALADERILVFQSMCCTPAEESVCLCRTHSTFYLPFFFVLLRGSKSVIDNCRECERMHIQETR